MVKKNNLSKMDKRGKNNAWHRVINKSEIIGI